MSKKTIESLNEWEATARPARAERPGRMIYRVKAPPETDVCPSEQPDVIKQKGAREWHNAGFRLTPVHIPKMTWVVDNGRKSAVGPVKPAAWPQAVCVVTKFVGDVAECKVSVSGYDLARVSLPAPALKARGLKNGARFIWIMRDANHIQLGDIDPDLSQAEPQLSESDARLLDDLHQKSVARRQLDGGAWPEYHGPG